MSEKTPSIEKLEKQLRVLKKKLERSEWHRVDLENQHDRDQHLYRRLHADLEAARRRAEIEAALERVRTKAMAMQKPEELSGISETVFTELKALGFTELRNTEIIINHKTEASITSYYYSDYGVTGVIDVDYTTNPTLSAWARDMQKADDAFAEVVIAEEDMEAWRDYRLSLGYVPDPKLDEAATVYYYSYSIGLGALSISAFQPVDAEQLSVLAQFRNVFNLAYQRYVDIARAEAQAREAQIQLALERIRAQSMLMQHSSELVATSAVFHEQLQALGVPTEFSYVWLPDEAAGKHQFWATWTEYEDGAPVHRSKAITYDLDKEEPYTAACFAAWASDDPIHIDFISPADIEHFFATWEELLREAEHLRSERFPDGIYYAEGYMQYGCFGINIRREPTEAERDILRRFAVEFERAYTRFLDLRRAEAQAREAQIEAALERVRSRTMAMHHSDEIAEVASVTFEQFQGLAFPSIRRISIGIMDTEANTMSFWASATTEGGSIRRVTVPMEENAVVRELVAEWRAGKSYFSLSYEGNTLQDFVAHITQHGWEYPAGEQMPERLLMNFVSYRYGLINASTYEPIGENEYEILQRFARVFEQTYTRFLDLKQAEAQAREAQIEVALERVRARAMAMHSSDELLDVIFKIHQEYSGLGLPCGAFWHTRYSPESYHKALTGIDGQKLAAIMELPRDFASNPALEAWERGDEKIGVFMFDADAACQYHHHMVTKGKFHEVDPEAITKEMIRENDGWTFVQARTSHGEIGYSLWGETEPSQEAKDVLVRFAKTFDLAYQRYVDIAQAEARAREAEIEAALERLRTRTMAMQSSDDLSDVIGRIFSELTHLDLVLTRCVIWVIDPETRSARFWMANAERPDEPDSYFIPYHDHPSYDAFLSAWDREETLWVYDLHGDLKTTWDKVLFTETELVRLPDDVKAGMAAPDRVLLTASFTSFGALHAASLEPLSDESTAILRRVAKVFDQTYTRYLDLEQAEAQAREAQIEASLERVRARAMAMHSSDDLSDATAIVFTELEKLGISTLRCGIVIIHETRHMDTWTATATSEDRDVRIVGRIDTTIHPLLEGVFEAWKAQQPFFTYELAGEDLQSYYQALRNAPDYAFPQDARPSARQFHYTFFFPEGALFTFSEQPLAEESIQIFKRFAAVFALTYRRYLDLKKAEEQAREAQINLAVERVRARALAMFKSEEILEVVFKLKEEVMGLDIPGVAAATIFLQEAGGNYRMWDLSSLELTEEKLHLSLDISFCLEDTDPDFYVRRVFADAGKYFLVIQDENDLQTTFQFLRDHDKGIQADEADQFVKATGLTHLYHPCVPLYNGRMCIDLLEPPAAEIESILTKMGAAFDLAYKRFEDLKKSEEQLREAQIEAALEKVRSRTMAMHKPDELQEVVTLVAEKLQDLGVIMDAGGVIICTYFPNSKDVMHWLASSDFSSSKPYLLPYSDHLIFNEAWASRESGDEFFSKAFSVEEKDSFFLHAFEHSDYKYFPDEFKEWVLAAEHHALTFAWSKNAAILIPSFTDIFPSESDKEILKRFARVFEQAYIRFLDLQQAEEQAREAERQAALDRVRAEIASMRTTADLPRITPLVWRELTTLGVPFFRCGVFIIDEAAETMQVFLTKPEGKALAALDLGFDDAPLVTATVAHWQQGAVYTEEWDADDMQAWTTFLQERGLIETSTRYLDAEAPPEHLALHFVPFEQGMLYVGSKEQLDAEAIESVQALADAFAVAYARYEDFQRLEVKNREVEAAMHELKATQQQLVHAEKMASLGSLTAGIAHEIKNPLNFINNFAALSKELAEELAEELEAGTDPEEIEAILADLKMNAAKIEEHGQRADGIVRGMMQHARGGEGQREAVDLNQLVDEYAALAYHGKRAQVPDFNAEVEKDLDADVGQVEVVPQEVGRVLLNLVGNAFDAVYEQQKRLDEAYAPRVTVSTRRTGDQVEIRVEDNGPGIPEDVRGKIFEPFFTTKPTGQGTGLGLSLSYDIITQGHGGTLTAQSEDGHGAAFVVTLPNAIPQPSKHSD